MVKAYSIVQASKDRLIPDILTLTLVFIILVSNRPAILSFLLYTDTRVFGLAEDTFRTLPGELAEMTENSRHSQVDFL
jgi:hypothetical protein